MTTKTGTIVALQKSLLKVETDHVIYNCEISGNLKNKKTRILVGDEVEFESTDATNGYIKKILPRENEFVRPRVANVKYSIVIVSVKEPNFSINQLEKLLINAELNKTIPIIVLTKVDLLSDEELLALEKEVSYYQTVYDVIFKRDPEDTYEQLLKIVGSSLSFMQGQTGAGKSTLLNEIDSNLNIKTNEISKKLNRGKHTTTHSEIINVRDLKVVDTPGFSSLEITMITNIDAEDLKYYYPDFVKLSEECKFRGKCNHINEPKCEVKLQSEGNETFTKRLKMYQTFFEELKNKKTWG